jgi:hypothetical protein
VRVVLSIFSIIHQSNGLPVIRGISGNIPLRRLLAHPKFVAGISFNTGFIAKGTARGFSAGVPHDDPDFL